MLRLLIRAAFAAWTFALVGSTLWLLSQNPFAEAVVARGKQDVRLALDRAIARTVRPEWLLPRLSQAIADDDPDLVLLYRDLAAEHRVAVPSDLAARAQGVVASHSGVIATMTECGTCVADVAACRSLALVAACTLPFEMSPLGDVNALRRAGVAWFNDGEVDELEVGLASLGLGATAAVLVSGGGSATIKVGATLVRLARRMGSLSPELLRAFRAALRSGTTGRRSRRSQAMSGASAPRPRPPRR